MHAFRHSIAMAAALCLSSAAHAITLDFNNLAVGPNTTGYVGDQLLNISGYKFTSTNGTRPGSENCLVVNKCFFSWGDYTLNSPSSRYMDMDPTGNTVVVENPFSITTVARVDGATFNFASIDLGDPFNNPSPALGGLVENFTFTYVNGSTATQNVTLDTVRGGQTFSFAQLGTGVKSVSWYTVTGMENNNGTIQFDNVVLTAPVPEPASLALMLAGMAAVGAAARARKQA